MNYFRINISSCLLFLFLVLLSQSLRAQYRGDPDCSEAGFGYAISCTKQQTCFIDQSIADPDGIGLNIVQWEWDFETDGIIDLTTNSSTNPCHIYPFAGPQTVSLYVTNDAQPPCIDTFQLIIDVNQTPVIYLSKEDISCNSYNDGFIDINVSLGTPNYNYYWADTSGANQSLLNHPIDSIRIDSLGPGMHYISVNDSSGCSSEDSIFISEPLGLDLNLNIVDSLQCYGASTASIQASFIGGTSPYDYYWLDQFGVKLDSTTSSILLYDTLNNVSSGGYTFFISDTNGCINSDSINVIQPEEMQFSIQVDSNVSCFGYNDGGISFNLTGGTSLYHYSWYDSNNAIIDSLPATISTSISIDSLYAGMYYIEVIDSSFCIKRDSFLILEPLLLSDSLYISQVVLCHGDSNGVISVDITGGTSPYSYTWSDSSGVISSLDTSLTSVSFDSLYTGMYYLTVKDTNMCLIKDSVFLNEPGLLTLNMTADTVTCFGDLGVVKSVVSGGTPFYSYSWSNGSTNVSISQNDSITGVLSGMYYLTVTDSQLCIINDSIFLAQNQELVLIGGSQDANCGNSDGYAWVSPSGGIIPYSYNWSGGNSNLLGDSVFNLGSAVYNVTVSDSLGCQDSMSFLVSDDPAPTIDSILINDVSCYGLSDGIIEVQTTSVGNDTFYIEQSNGQTPFDTIGPQISNIFNNLKAGLYYLYFSDSTGCQKIDSFIINEPPNLLPPDTFFVQDTICLGDTILAYTNLTSGAFSYSWSFGGIGGATIVDSSLIYDSIYVVAQLEGALDICVRSLDTCGLSDSSFCRKVQVLGAPQAPLGILGALQVCENKNYTYSISNVLGATGYYWSFPNGVQIISGQGTTSIEVSFPVGLPGGNVCVRSYNQCDSSIAVCEGFLVYSSPDIPGTINGVDSVCIGDTVIYSVASVAGATEYQWSWPGSCQVIGATDQDSITIVWGPNAGQICVRSANFCDTSSYSCIGVSNPAIGVISPIYSNSGSIDTLCVGDTLSLYVSPVTGADTYVWTLPPSGIQLIQDNGPQILVSITDSLSFGIIKVFAYNTCDSTSISSQSIYLSLNPIADFLFNDSVCAGEVISFTDISFSADYWQWDFGDGQGLSVFNNPTYTYNNGGSFITTLIVNNGFCSDTITKTVSIYDLPSIDFTYSDSCFMDTISFSGITGSQSSIVSWVWDFGDIPDIGDSAYLPNTQYIYDTSGQYMIVLSVFDTNNCYNQVSKTINIYDVYVDGGIYECIYKGESLNLNAIGQNVLSYQWYPEESLDNSTISDPVSSADENTTYILTVVSPEGCIAIDTVEVCVDERKEIFLPTAFTPNSDGKNDYYKLGGHGICDIEIFIYNRWGEQVFYSSDLSIGWDGVYNQELQGTDKYAVIVKGAFCDGTTFGPENSTEKAPGIGSFILFR